ncbi:ExeM/NucH family extracellular endonuclease [Marinobacter caseinilyticus]|uniref:ExeM/NucH family extracellular endonuclease n=1 Tax=Marinobacter caseinilyticus TaxID=2692195 RepID=UPI001408427C|nr:ExeM/NucH family extracellular endonuclease [Marinobacter caseinilyticus]
MRAMRYTLALLIMVMTAIAAVPPVLAADCHTPVTPISQIQGNRSESPLQGAWVTVRGVITLDTRAQGFKGFYLQQADGETDDDPSTSEALFVYTSRPTGATGHQVEVTGRVREYYGLTEVVNVKILRDCGPAPMPTAQPLSLPWPSAEPPERFENMRVRFTRALTVIDHHNLHRFGELTLATETQFVPTQRLVPGLEAAALAQVQERQRIILDDGSGQKYPSPIPYPLPALTMSRTVRTGDRASKLTGVLDYRFGAWRLQPDSSPRFESANPRPPPPPRPSESAVRVVALNVENYFNGDGNGGGFPTPRGAQSQTALKHQTARLVAALTALDADLLILAEIENDGDHPDSALAQLAAALGPDWQWVRTGPVRDRRLIRSAMLYHSRRLAIADLTRPALAQPYDGPGRHPVVQDFKVTASGDIVRAVAAHFKSKSCRGAQAADRDQNDGQGCYASTRLEQARALSRWLTRLPTPARSLGTLIAGDLNSYAREAPLQHLARAGYHDLVGQRQGLTSYSYRFRGRAGTLDYVLAKGTVNQRIIGARLWHINSDEPAALGYQRWQPDAAGPTHLPWRASDHDPVVIDMAL